MNEPGETALQAFDLIKASVEELKKRLSVSDAALLDNLLDLQSWANQVSYGERVSLARGRLLMNQIIEISGNPTV